MTEKHMSMEDVYVQNNKQNNYKNLTQIIYTRGSSVIEVRWKSG